MTLAHVTFTQDEHDLAVKILDLFDNNPKRWTQQACARDAYGTPVSVHGAGDPVCWCLFGAACHIARLPGNRYGLENVLESACRKARNDPDFCYIHWQDRMTRTFSEVRDLLESIVAGPIEQSA